jgi:hypothetical protein
MVGIALIFILAAVLIITGIALLCTSCESWIGATLIATGAFVLLWGILKLDDEKGIFSKRIEKKQKEKGEKISSGKFKTCALNMVPMFIKAYDEHKEYGKEYAEMLAVNGIATGFNTILKNWIYVFNTTDYFEQVEAIKSEQDIRNVLNEAFEVILALFIETGESMQHTYEAYRKICKKTKLTVRTKAELKKISEKALAQDLNGAISTYKMFSSVSRECMSASSYEKMVQGFCYLSVLGGSVHENEYSVIYIYFFSEQYGDKYPKTWEQFKIEYK